MNKNLKTYSSKNVVNWYAHLNEIISVEKVIFEKINQFWKMLCF